MPISPTQAQSSIRNLQVEASNLNSSALVTLYEIDLTDMALSRGIHLDDREKVFRFHNSLKLTTSDIKFQSNKYFVSSIQTEGFEISSKGVLPTPTLRIVVNDAAVSLLAVLKDKIRVFEDLVGAKFTRRRTFAKFLDISNFNSDNQPINLATNESSEFPKDVWFINRKTRENKFIIEYELGSILDLENIQLPRRTIISKRCNFNYRGEGCNYEYNSRRNDDVHGEFAILPEQAPAVATEEDKLIKDILGVAITDSGPYNSQLTYIQGQSVYTEQEGIKYYFVAKTSVPRGGIPPNTSFWIEDKCSKCIKACKIRFGDKDPEGSAIMGQNGLIKGQLPFGGFPSTERLRGNS